MKELADIELSAKQVRRMTEQVGKDRLDERQERVALFKGQPLMERLESSADIESPDLGVVMMDGGRYQRRDHFGEADYDGSHWKEDKVGIVLHMQSAVHESDPHPEFPAWLASAEVVREIASLGAIDEENSVSPEEQSATNELATAPSNWDRLTPALLSREVIASSECGTDFGHHLESVAWQQGVIDAPKTAFVADGASVNWAIHKRHFSLMTGILDLMHALSYAWKASKALDDSASYQRYAKWIWQGDVRKVIEELQSKQRPANKTSPDDSQDDPITRAITYFTNHQHLMNDPQYRKRGLPLTSSHIAVQQLGSTTTIKLINIRMKGSEKFFGQDTGETLLQLRSDSLCEVAV